MKNPTGANRKRTATLTKSATPCTLANTQSARHHTSTRTKPGRSRASASAKVKCHRSFSPGALTEPLWQTSTQATRTAHALRLNPSQKIAPASTRTSVAATPENANQVSQRSMVPSSRHVLLIIQHRLLILFDVQFPETKVAHAVLMMMTVQQV